MTRRLTHEQHMDRLVKQIEQQLRGCVLTRNQADRLFMAVWICAATSTLVTGPPRESDPDLVKRTDLTA